MEKILSEHEILQMLHESDCEVTFRKVDGEIRVMPCTLRAAALPVKPALTEDASVKTRARSPGVISAWSLDRKEWRSFKVSNVIAVTKLS